MEVESFGADEADAPETISDEDGIDAAGPGPKQGWHVDLQLQQRDPQNPLFLKDRENGPGLLDGSSNSF